MRSRRRAYPAATLVVALLLAGACRPPDGDGVTTASTETADATETAAATETTADPTDGATTESTDDTAGSSTFGSGVSFGTFGTVGTSDGTDSDTGDEDPCGSCGVDELCVAQLVSDTCVLDPKDVFTFSCVAAPIACGDSPSCDQQGCVDALCGAGGTCDTLDCEPPATATPDFLCGQV